MEKFVFETLPPRGTDPTKYISFCICAVENGAQVIAVTDLPMGSARVSPFAPAHLLVERGIDVLMHFSRRTRNAIRIEGDLLACHMLGIKNLLVLSGDDPREGTYPFSTSVEDFSIYDVFKLIKEMNEKKADLAGVKLYGEFDFNPGGVFTPHVKNIEETLSRALEKEENGAKFFVSQPVFEFSTVEKVLKKMKSKLKSKIYLSLMVFETVSQMEYFSKVPGVYIPEEYKENAESDEKIKEYSLRNAIKIIEMSNQYVYGYYLTSTTRDLDVVQIIAKEISKVYNK